MAVAYRRLLLFGHLPQRIHLDRATHHLYAPAAAALSAPSRPFAFSTPERVEPPLGVFRAGFTSDNNFSYSWHQKFGSTVGAILIGQAAFFIGLSGGSALAQEDSVSLAAPASEQTERNATGLQKIEDGSVISNEHTIKWRLFTDNARDYFQKRQLDEAEKLFQAALREAKEGFGLRDPHVASALNNLAEFYRLRKEYEKAELLYLEAIEILEESFGFDDIRVGTALHSLGICYHLQHRFSQAQACYERALKIEGRVMGVGHQEYSSTMYLLAKVLIVQGKRKDAESLIEESIRILEEAGLGESPICIQRMRYLATELSRSNRFSEAENWQRKILHALELSKGWDSLETANAAGLLSLTLQFVGKLKESEELLERCLAVKRKILPELHFMIQHILQMLQAPSQHAHDLLCFIEKVAGTMVQLARLTLQKFAVDFMNINSNVATYYLHRAKQLTDDSIRIIDGILNSTSTSNPDMNKIGAVHVLLQALDVVGLVETGVKHTRAPGLVILLRLPLERMKHGSFKIDAVSISDTCRLFIWPDINIIDVRYTTLRIHFKSNFGKERDNKPIEQALDKCISLYKKPNTRNIVLKTLKKEYVTCLRRLIEVVEEDRVISQTKLQELLGEAQQIMEELGEASNRKK